MTQNSLSSIVSPASAAQTATPADSAQALFDPVERSPAYTRVSSAIEQKILTRALRAGDVLPAETDLAQQFRVHRSTVREALRQLESAGLVARPQGAKRMVVSRPEAAKVASGMRHALVLHDVTFVDVWEAMMVLEPQVAALAALRRDDAQLRDLHRAAEAFRLSPQGDPQAVDVVLVFFEILGRASRNQVLVLAKQAMSQALAPSLAKMIDTVPQARTRISDAHRHLVAAVRERDSQQARQWMEKHVSDFKRGYEVAGISPATPISM